MKSTILVFSLLLSRSRALALSLSHSRSRTLVLSLSRSSHHALRLPSPLHLFFFSLRLPSPPHIMRCACLNFRSPAPHQKF